MMIKIVIQVKIKYLKKNFYKTYWNSLKKLIIIVIKQYSVIVHFVSNVVW